MPWKALAAPKFNRMAKKLPKPLRDVVYLEINKILENPYIGEPKTGDLKGVIVHKFQYLQEEYLLAYKLDKKGKTVIFLAIGGHENFYRDLKRYI